MSIPEALIHAVSLDTRVGLTNGIVKTLSSPLVPQYSGLSLVSDADPTNVGNILPGALLSHLTEACPHRVNQLTRVLLHPAGETGGEEERRGEGGRGEEREGGRGRGREGGREGGTEDEER